MAGGMPRNEFQAWLRALKAEKDWSLVKIHQRGGPVPSRMTGFLKHGMKPSRENSDRIAVAFELDADDVWARVQRAFRGGLGEDDIRNVEALDLNGMSQEQAALLAPVLRGVLRVVEAIERGEA